MSHPERKYDIVILGATGFTGRIVVAELAALAVREGVRFAIAGRDPEKLRKVASEFPELEFEVIVADVSDPISLTKMAAQANIIVNCAGPFALYGMEVVRACVQAGTHYMDITGEPAFVHAVHRNFDAQAKSGGVAIVNCCGFDSIPADYAAWMAAGSLKGSGPKLLRGYVFTNARFSGGTWTTAIHAIHRRTSGADRPARPSSPKRTRRIPLKVHYLPYWKRWALPMPVVDPHIVRRSAALLPEVYGVEVEYAQFYTVRSLWDVVRLVFNIGLVFVLVRWKVTRDWLFRKFPAGTGPSPEARSKFYFRVLVEGEQSEQRVHASLSGGDPGYDDTAKMLVQAALTLREHIQEGKVVAGATTPVVALGGRLLERLKERGIKVQQEDISTRV